MTGNPSSQRFRRGPSRGIFVKILRDVSSHLSQDLPCYDDSFHGLEWNAAEHAGGKPTSPPHLGQHDVLDDSNSDGDSSDGSDDGNHNAPSVF